jgi:DnaJ-class molecular chaperone
VSADEQEDIPCGPCRATGKVISNLGGTRQEVPCPWCEGSGTLTPGHDAQSRWRDQPPAPPDAA